MIDMNRRHLLRLSGGAFCSLLAGCGKRDEDWEVRPTLAIYYVINTIDSAWEVDLRISNKYRDDGVEFHNVKIIGFNDTGEEVCRTQVGDFTASDSIDQRETMTCEEFPAIITAIANESPCDGARIRLLYFIGEEERQRDGDINDSSLWNETYRECNEDLPPERVLENVSQSN